METPKHKPHVNIGTIKSDNTQTLANALNQIKNLEAEKAELLEALEKSDAIIRNRITGSDSLEEAKSILDLRKKVESLIKKHKQ